MVEYIDGYFCKNTAMKVKDNAKSTQKVLLGF
jgi:hypothetical protein